MDDHVSIVVADDHPMIRSGLRQAIERDGHYHVVAEAADGIEALERITELLPSLAVLDIQMPGMGGLDVIVHIDRANLPVRSIILTMHDEEEMFNEALDLGVQGYILKDSTWKEILQCLRAVEKGQYYFSPSLSGLAVKNRRDRTSGGDGVLLLHRLSPAERRILKCVSTNMQTAEIAEQFSVSPRTVDSHRANICRKLDLSGAYALLRFALQHAAEL